MRLNLKYNAIRVDEIEQVKKAPIENCIADTTVGGLALFVMKGLVDENGVHGVSRNKAIGIIDEYLQEHDKDELVMDIMEALIAGGFLSRDLDMAKLREVKKTRAIQVNENVVNMI